MRLSGYVVRPPSLLPLQRYEAILSWNYNGLLITIDMALAIAEYTNLESKTAQRHTWWGWTCMETGGMFDQHFFKDTIKQNFTSIGMMREGLYVHTLLQATISRDS